MDKLLEDYETLQDNDPLTAYSLMKRASALLSNYETQAAHLEKWSGKVKTLAQSIESETILNAGGSISKGERMAACSDQVIKGWNSYYSVRERLGKTQAVINNLNRIYWVCQLVWKSAKDKEQREKY
jgi:hypothetical protein